LISEAFRVSASGRARKDAGVPLRTLLAYGGPMFGVAYLLFFVQFYFLQFATDVLLLAPSAVGAVFAAAKLWDAFSNPLAGSWSDRTRTRLGRRRPFLWGALPLLIVGFAMLWTPPAALAGTTLVLWCAGALFVFFLGFALYTIPHMALGAELTQDGHERTRLFGARQISFTIGMLLAFPAMQYAMNAQDPRAAAASLALPTALLAALVLTLVPLTVKERSDAQVAGGRGLFSGLRDVWANTPARIVLVVWLIENAGVGAVGTLAPYLAKYVLQRQDVVGLLPAAYVLSGIAAIPLWVRLSRRHAARRRGVRRHGLPRRGRHRAEHRAARGRRRRDGLRHGDGRIADGGPDRSRRAAHGRAQGGRLLRHADVRDAARLRRLDGARRLRARRHGLRPERRAERDEPARPARALRRAALRRLPARRAALLAGLRGACAADARGAVLAAAKTRWPLLEEGAHALLVVLALEAGAHRARQLGIA
jgi:MFS family permease